ncbi:hypothetical protein LXL04_023691 [Taraxacum kok-saghyz]
MWTVNFRDLAMLRYFDHVFSSLLFPELASLVACIFDIESRQHSHSNSLVLARALMTDEMIISVKFRGREACEGGAQLQQIADKWLDVKVTDLEWTTRALRYGREDDRSLTQVSFSTGISRLNRRWGPGITRPEILGIQTRFGLETLTWRFQNISPASLVISTSDCASVPLITQTCFIFLGSEDAFF